MKKRLLSWFLCFVMVFSLLPISALAEDSDAGEIHIQELCEQEVPVENDAPEMEIDAQEASASYTVSFDLNGKDGIIPEAQTVNLGDFIIAPDAPMAEGYLFTGWYTDAAYTEETLWDFAANTVGDNITLYAGWVAEPSETLEILPMELQGEMSLLAAPTGYLRLLNSNGTYAPSDAYSDYSTTFHIKGSGPYILEMGGGTVTSQGVFIQGTGDLELTLRNVNIDRSTESAGTGPVAFTIAEYAGNVTIVLEGNNSLKGGEGSEGLYKSTDSAKSLSITGTGSLTAVGGSGQAVIGGGSNRKIIVPEGRYAAVQRGG